LDDELSQVSELRPVAPIVFILQLRRLRVSLPGDIKKIEDELDAAESDARALTAGLAEAHGRRRAKPGSWSVAQCLDHMGVTNRVYIAAMEGPAIRARQQGRLRRREAIPGWIGGFFVRMIEPPVKARIKAPPSIVPSSETNLADAFTSFMAGQDQVRAYLYAYNEIDLASVRFPNPFMPGMRFSLATGLHIIVAHERRHLWQAWRAREAAEAANE
jgi:hypothetical protein